MEMKDIQRRSENYCNSHMILNSQSTVTETWTKRVSTKYLEISSTEYTNRLCVMVKRNSVNRLVFLYIEDILSSVWYWEYGVSIVISSRSLY